MERPCCPVLNTSGPNDLVQKQMSPTEGINQTVGSQDIVTKNIDTWKYYSNFCLILFILIFFSLLLTFEQLFELLLFLLLHVLKSFAVILSRLQKIKITKLLTIKQGGKNTNLNIYIAAWTNIAMHLHDDIPTQSALCKAINDCDSKAMCCLRETSKNYCENFQVQAILICKNKFVLVIHIC